MMGYSDSQNISRYIEENLNPIETIAVYPDYASHSISGIVKNKTYLVTNQRLDNYYTIKSSSSYLIEDKELKKELNEEILNRVKEKNIEYLLLTSPNDKLDDFKELKEKNLVLYETRENNVIDERFILLRVIYN